MGAGLLGLGNAGKSGRCCCGLRTPYLGLGLRSGRRLHLGVHGVPSTRDARGRNTGDSPKCGGLGLYTTATGPVRCGGGLLRLGLIVRSGDPGDRATQPCRTGATASRLTEPVPLPARAASLGEMEPGAAHARRSETFDKDLAWDPVLGDLEHAEPRPSDLAPRGQADPRTTRRGGGAMRAPCQSQGCTWASGLSNKRML
mmetsp:Transcript_110867/g.254058  ORF Transcript_110867/g.254058 Transcript_110867/m.254058 type:complete len:200 (+) Transcript_110867:1149-1748(+)